MKIETHQAAGQQARKPAGEKRRRRPALLGLLCLLCLAVAPRASAQAIRMQSFSVVNTSTTVPKQLTNATVYCTSFTIEGKAAAQGAANAGTLYLGMSATDGVNSYPILSGGIYMWNDPKGRQFDLSTLYIDVTSANDGVTVTYW